MAKKRLSIKVTWWWSTAIQEQLTIWTKMLISRRLTPYKVLLNEEGSGYHDWQHHIIQANCQMFPNLAVRIQFLLTQAILAHECGHALFTEARPEAQDDMLNELHNILEDEREERCMVAAYPGIQGLFEALAKQMWKKQDALRGPDNLQAFALCLVWRFAYRFASETQVLKRTDVSPHALILWEKIRPLVEKAWTAPTSGEVVGIAREILEILGIHESTPARPIPGGFGVGDGHDIPTKRAESALPFPTGPDPEVRVGVMHKGGRLPTPSEPGTGETCSAGRGMRRPPDPDEADAPADFDPATDQIYEYDPYSAPAPYQALQEEARSLANQIAESLKLPDPKARTIAHVYKGRYSARQAVRRPDKPCAYQAGQGDSSHGIALFILTDRSGSMGRIKEPVRLAMMALYSGATRADVRIPTGLGFFGADGREDKTLLVAPLCPEASPEALALIAGFDGTTSNEFLYWGLIMAAEQLQPFPRHHRVILVVHDGDPVYSGAEGNDRLLSQKYIQALGREGILVIGIYLGRNETFRPDKLEKLFGRNLIITTPEKLPDRLCQMVINIVSGQQS